ncbi:MFS transporter [Fimbriiglobus ruber]|uniref:Putative transporter n=1 Tax=Fimbriiglobus ruber TaxID=1908690 RepID=A0A225DT91_9BACT|nr:MFS transporter [Fimbriiglobus ruber]OWK40806.1 putative transporter [Fimbriiglobus ruber]
MSTDGTDNPVLEVPPSRSRGMLRDNTFRSLKHRNYRLYFFGQIVSFTGSWMQSAALMWLVYDRTGDPRWPPLMLVAQVGPTVLLGTWGGALADRWPKRSLIFLTQSGFLVTASLLTGLAAADLAEPWLLLAIQLANGTIQSIDLPARLAFVPDLVPRADLINAVSLNSLLFNSARAVGPAVTGLVFLLADAITGAGWLPGVRPVVAGASLCFGLNAVSFVAVLIALRLISVPGVGAHKNQKGSVWDGFRYVIENPRAGGLLVLTGAICVAGWPALTLFPAYTKLALGLAEKEYSLLVSGLGGGALVAALTTATFGSVARRGFFLAAGAWLMVAGLAGLAAAGGLDTAVASAGCLGFGMILYLSTGQSALQLNLPDDKRGRVMALWAMTLSASAPIGHLMAGQAATVWPIREVLAGMAVGAGVIAVGVLTIAVRGWKRAARPGREATPAE